MNCKRYEPEPKISNDESMAWNEYSKRKSTKLSSVSRSRFFFLSPLIAFLFALPASSSRFVCVAIVNRDKNYLFSISPDKPIPNRFVDDVSLSVHRTKQRTIELSLFTASTRPHHIQRLYEKAAAAATLPVSNGPHMGKTSNVDDCFLMRCSPVLGSTRHKITRKIDTEIETRIVSAYFARFSLCIQLVLGSFKYAYQTHVRPKRFLFHNCHCNSCEKENIQLVSIALKRHKIVCAFFRLSFRRSFFLPLCSRLPLKISANARRAKRSAKLQSVRIVSRTSLAVHCTSQRLATVRMRVSLRRTWTALMCRRRHPIQSMRSSLPQTMCHWTISFPHPKNNAR